MKMRRGSGDSLLILILLAAAGYWYFFMGGATVLVPNSVVNVVTITYVDGSTAVFNEPKLIPQYIAQVGQTKAISNIKFDTKAAINLPTGYTSVSGVTWSVVGSISSGKTGGTLTNRGTISALSSLPTALTSGVYVTVASTTITEAQLNAWVPLDYSNYDIKANVSVVCTFLEPGTANNKEVSAAQTSTVAVTNVGFPATLSVTISPTVTTK